MYIFDGYLAGFYTYPVATPYTFKIAHRFKAKFKPVTEAIFDYLQCDWLLIVIYALPNYLGHLLLMSPMC